MKLLTWGRSAEGQLGVDLGQGSASTLVDALLPQRQPTCFPQVGVNAKRHWAEYVVGHTTLQLRHVWARLPREQVMYG